MFVYRQPSQIPYDVGGQYREVGIPDCELYIMNLQTQVAGFGVDAVMSSRSVVGPSPCVFFFFFFFFFFFRFLLRVAGVPTCLQTSTIVQRRKLHPAFSFTLNYRSSSWTHERQKKWSIKNGRLSLLTVETANHKCVDMYLGTYVIGCAEQDQPPLRSILQN